MVLAEEFTMSRTDEVNRLTENVYKVSCSTQEESFRDSHDGGVRSCHTHTLIPPRFADYDLLAKTHLESCGGFFSPTVCY